MPRYDRPRWRLMDLLREQLLIRRRRQLESWALAAAMPLSGFDRHRQLQRQLQHAARRGLDVLAANIRQQLAIGLSDLRAVLEAARNQLQAPLPPEPSLRELMAELTALEEEFGSVTCDASKRLIEVHTEPIELEGLYLGPFALQMQFDEMTHSSNVLPLSVVALDPQPAGGQSHVTHPHVSDERLCAGEAYGLLQRTLGEGRLSEFFLIVRQVLGTYNRDSPYVPIDEWHGEPCEDCGVRTDDEDRCVCEGCDRTYCSECMASCPHCDDSVCCGCLNRCDGCHEPACDGCLVRCENCSRSLCPGCMDGALCSACQEAMDEEHAEEESDEPEPEEDEHHDPTTQPQTHEPITVGHTQDQPPEG